MRSRVIAFAVAIALLAATASAGVANGASLSYGVVPQTDLDARDFRLMHRGGIDSVRIWFPWTAIDPAAPAGDYDFATTDAIVADAARGRVRVLPFLFATPPWVVRQLDHRGCGDCAVYAPRSPAALEAWADFVRAAVDRYGPGGAFWLEHPELRPRPIRVWQVWNEPNSRVFFAPRPSPRGYARVLRAASRAVASGDPGAKVILGGMAQLAGSRKAVTGTSFLRRLYRIKGIEKVFDGVAVHPYGARAGTAIDQVERFRAEARRARDPGSSLWVTEVGWSSAHGGHPLDVGLRGQAQRLRATFGYLRRNRGRLNLGGAFWYSWMDTRAPVCAWCKKSGLVRRGLRAKPAWRAMRAIAR
jgi:polysaccharide biosynthesis protein PslG